MSLFFNILGHNTNKKRATPTSTLLEGIAVSSPLTLQPFTSQILIKE